jgi:hypothetical protein
MNLLNAILVSGVLQFGLVPGHNLCLFKIPDYTDNIYIGQTYIVDYQATANILKVGFLTGGFTSYQWATPAKINFYPYRIDYAFGAGLKYKTWEAGWKHGCFHAIACNVSELPLPKLDLSQDYFYMKVEMGRQ